MEEWRLKTALSSRRKQWTNRLYKQAGAQKKLPCFTGFNLWLLRACHTSWWSRSCYLDISESRSWSFAPILDHDILSKILLMGLRGGSQFSTLPLKGYSSANHAYKAAQHWLETSLYELEGWGGFSLQKCWSVVISGMRSSRLHVYCTFRWAASAL